MFGDSSGSLQSPDWPVYFGFQFVPELVMDIKQSVMVVTQSFPTVTRYNNS